MLCFGDNCWCEYIGDNYWWDCFGTFGILKKDGVRNNEALGFWRYSADWVLVYHDVLISFSLFIIHKKII